MSKKALCIGINDYPGTSMDLSGCANDARDWKEVLKERGFVVAGLLNAQATGNRIRDCLLKMTTNAEPGDTLVITYSGHGTFVPDMDGDEGDGNDEAICPYDIMTDGPIVDDEFYSIFKLKRPEVKIILISDSCHSGTLSRSLSVPGGYMGEKRYMPARVFSKDSDLPVAGVEVRHISTDGMAFHDTEGIFLLLAGCQDHEYSYDAVFGNRANGAFTRAAIDSLYTLDPKASYESWFKAIRKRLPSKHYPQTPNLAGTGRELQVFS